MRAAGGSIVATLERNAERYRGKRAFTWLDASAKEVGTLTFAELRAQSLAVCCALRRSWAVATGEENGGGLVVEQSCAVAVTVASARRG